MIPEGAANLAESSRQIARINRSIITNKKQKAGEGGITAARRRKRRRVARRDAIRRRRAGGRAAAVVADLRGGRKRECGAAPSCLPAWDPVFVSFLFFALLASVKSVLLRKQKDIINNKVKVEEKTACRRAEEPRCAFFFSFS
jgi:hypothetical protein